MTMTPHTVRPATLVSFLASLLIRGLILGTVGIMGVLGFLILCPFPSFWRDLLTRDKGYAE